MQSRIGIFGGSFDPSHNGHLHVLRSAAEQWAFAQILVVPALKPPHKPWRRLAAPHHRLAMCQLLCAEQPGLAVEDCELWRGGTSYTLDTITTLRARDEYHDVDFCFLIGSDSLVDLPAWSRIDALAKEVTFVIIPRESETQANLKSTVASLRTNDGQPLQAVVLNVKPLPVSSTEIRARCGRGEAIDALVPVPIAAYIAAHQLYRPGKTDVTIPDR